MTKNIDEQRVAGSNYILNFYQHVIVITENYADYNNAMLELELKYGDKIGVMEEAEKLAIRNIVQTLRFNLEKTLIQYETILATKSLEIDDKVSKEIKATYAKTRRELFPKVDDVKELVTSLNIFLGNDIIRNLLKSSNAMAENIYND
jgi:hypothetical protein